jgi:hypothetical protein
MNNTCVMCGKIIPEGLQVCPMCAAVARNESYNRLTIAIRAFTEACHAIGLDSALPKKRGGQLYYTAYRNYFQTNVDDEKWQLLERQGYAKHGEVSESGMTYYHMTRRGLDFMESILGIKIEELE